MKTKPKQKFARNPWDIKDVLESSFNYALSFTIDSYQVTGDIHISKEAFHSLLNDFYAQRDYLQGKGGVLTIEPIPKVIYEMHDDEKIFNLCRCVVRVTGDGEFPYALLIDPQGFGYARYVAVEFLK